MKAKRDTILALHVQPFGLADDQVVPLEVGVLLEVMLLVSDSSFEVFPLVSDCGSPTSYMVLEVRSFSDSDLRS